MLFSSLLLFFFLLFVFMYFGVLLSLQIGNSPYRGVIWILFFATILTTLEVIFCFYLYIKFRQKNGEEGPRGFHGKPGKRGDDGKCEQKKCHLTSIKVMIEKIFEKKLGRQLNSSELRKIDGLTLDFNKSTEETPLYVNYSENSDTCTDANKNNYKCITYDKLKKYHDAVTLEVERDLIKVDNNMSSETLVNSLKAIFRNV